MIDSSSLIFSTAYLPPIEYMVWLVGSKSIMIESHENYKKQSYRNRCVISTANGMLSLSIPVTKTFGNHTTVKDVKIDNSEKWQKRHWRAIESAYNQSPFFLFYKDEFEFFFLQRYKYLFDFNTELLQTSLKLLKVNLKIAFSDLYINSYSGAFFDLRNKFSPKVKSDFVLPEYRQVFMDKLGFFPNLSIIDLLFNVGNQSSQYLQSIKNLKV